MRYTISVLVISVIGLSQFHYLSAGKSGNEHTDTEERKFRSGKAQQVWDKAIRMKLSPVQMTDLYGDLKHHDQLIMEFKRIKSKQGDEDGLKEAELTESLHDIMVKYGLVGKKTESADKKKKPNNKRFAEDPELENLWITANKHGKFTENELEALHLEFTHHRRKVEELEILKSEASEFDDMSDNSVEKQLAQEEHHERKRKIDELHEDIEENYERLILKTKRGTLNADSVPFTEPRVNELWQEAKKGNFTDKELDSIKEELLHFQKRIEKHLFFRDQLKNSVEKIKFHGGEESAPTQHMDTHNHLQNKVQDLAAKVKKLHHELSKKLSSKQVHREL